MGLSASFSVTATGSAPLYYQWQLNGSAIVGATNSALVLTNLTPAQSGDYSAIVFNAAGSTVSSNAALVILYPPTFYQQPDSQSVQPGTVVTFSSGGSGTQPLITNGS